MLFVFYLTIGENYVYVNSLSLYIETGLTFHDIIVVVFSMFSTDMIEYKIQRKIVVKIYIYITII